MGYTYMENGDQQFPTSKGLVISAFHQCIKVSPCMVVYALYNL